MQKFRSFILKVIGTIAPALLLLSINLGFAGAAIFYVAIRGENGDDGQGLDRFGFLRELSTTHLVPIVFVLAYCLVAVAVGSVFRTWLLTSASLGPKSRSVRQRLGLGLLGLLPSWGSIALGVGSLDWARFNGVLSMPVVGVVTLVSSIVLFKCVSYRALRKQVGQGTDSPAGASRSALVPGIGDRVLPAIGVCVFAVTLHCLVFFGALACAMAAFGGEQQSFGRGYETFWIRPSFLTMSANLFGAFAILGGYVVVLAAFGLLSTRRYVKDSGRQVDRPTTRHLLMLGTLSLVIPQIVALVVNLVAYATVLQPFRDIAPITYFLVSLAVYQRWARPRQTAHLASCSKGNC
jgi:hypothetical protein